ncbi:hypothetical protein [Candidatus Pelagisphaera phototrophica]|uniref:hypothetical protein n=1 Tax=Candidatus Pelagisphaera phototrophica TaxID=2684113 RepID=UPI001A094774|nr:hypothetical protein [Candidatus Pelagisphaera phototrophica]QXD33155.1 hypothetical protein GA004_05445 [Candidatus Pelagisphaera phototrophica]
MLGISPLTGAGGAYGATDVADLSGLAIDVESGILYGIDSTTDSLLTIKTTTGGSRRELLNCLGLGLRSGWQGSLCDK